MSVVNEDVLENGASRSGLAEAAAVLYSGLLLGEYPEPAGAELPWLAAVGVVAGYDAGSGDAGIAVSIREVAGGIRKAHLRLSGGDEELPFEALDPRMQFAWEAAARFLVWGVTSDDAAGDGLAGGLADWSQKAEQEKARRGIN